LEAALWATILNRASSLLTRKPGGNIIISGKSEIGSKDRTWVYLPRLKTSIHYPAVLDLVRKRPSRQLLNILGDIVDAYPEQGYRGRIRQVWPTANRSKATVELRAEFIDRDEKLIPELGVRVVFVPESEANPTPPQVLLSKKALLLSESPTVLVVRNGIIEVRAITLRDDLGDDLIEVGSGLIGGETVVIDPDPTLKSGDRVQVRRP
jgi:multidrug efflux pump subunit AcrA (membrane-fusion protein)